MVYAKAGLWILLAGVVLLAREADSLRGSALVAELKAKAKAALNNPTETVEEVVTVEGDTEGGNTTTNVTVVKTKSLLTGIPQKDYIYDPNLPRELNGYNLTNYPFYNGVPENITFKCDDLHDGFYASVPHKCQVYHHCLFGTRYDFLCANYTAFDQKTFICHFVSEVDCDNSPKYYQRNEALYKSASTTSAPIVLQTTTTTTAAPTAASAGGGDGATQRPRRRRPYRRRRPVYEYYYDDQYDDDEYYDDDPPPPPPPPRRKMNRKHRPSGGFRDDDEEDYHDTRRGNSRGEGSRGEGSRGEGSRGEGSRGGSFRGESNRGNSFRGENDNENSKEAKPTLRVSGPASGTIYDQPRVPPKVRRPVPLNERDKYGYNSKNSDTTPAPTQEPKKSNKQKPKVEEDDEEYYDDEYEDDYVKPPPKRMKQGGSYNSDSGEKVESRRANSRNRPRQQSQRRPDRHEDDYEDRRSFRPRKKSRHEDSSEMSRGNRGGNKGYSREEPDPVPAERPGYISSSRYSTGNRKRTDDSGRGHTTKKPSRVVYDDEDDEEEYYDYEEEPEEGLTRRNTKPNGGGRRNEEPESENERGSQRKTSNVEPSPKANLRPQIATKNQRETGKVSNRDYDLSSTKKRLPTNQCRDECEEDYSDESYDDRRGEKKSNNQGDNVKQDSKDDLKQISEREKLFSSRFRDSINDGKRKQENSDNSGSGKVSQLFMNPKTATQQPEITQRYKPAIRTRPSTEDQYYVQKPTTTTSTPSEDYAELSTTVGNKYLNFRPKGRNTSPAPLYNNPKAFSTTEKTYQVSEMPELNNPYDTRHSEVMLPERTLVPQRPTNNAGKQYSNKNSNPTTETVFQESFRQPSIGLNYRQPSLVNEDEEKPVSKPIPSTQNYRRFKPEPTSTENGEYVQQKSPYIGTNFRRPNKQVEEVRTENIAPVREREESRNADDNVMKDPRTSTPERAQPGPDNYGGSYRRVKISAMTTSAPEIQQFTQPIENVQSYQPTNPPYQGAPNPSPINSYKRPYLVGKPINNNYPDAEETTKNTLPLSNNYRRPVKNRIQYSEPLTSVGDFTSTSAAGGVGESYNNGEAAPGTNLRQSSVYFPPKRVKIQIDDGAGRGLEQFSKQQPKIEITAPGPSAPDIDLANVKTKNYNSQPRFPLDIPEEEYDVTLNDALQPSTLHPTRSLVDYQQARLKTRDYQPNLERTAEYVNRGRVAYLLPAASQQHITKVQSVFLQNKQEEPQNTNRYSERNAKRPSSIDQEEYEAVVLAASNDQWPNQRRNQPTEWYW